MQACEKYSDLSRVRREFKVSSHFIYEAYYERLRLKLREIENAPWPSAIGMDEHAYGKNKEFRRTQFVTTIVNHNQGRMFEEVIGIVADTFHVLRLLTPALLRKRKEISGTRADLRAKSNCS